MVEIAHFLIRWRYALTVATLIFSVITLYGVTKTSMDVGYSAILSEADPYKEEVDRATEDFPSTPSVLFAFQAKPDVFQRRALQAMDALNQRFNEIEGAIAMGSLMNSRLNDVQAERYNRDYLIPELQELDDEHIEVIRRLALDDDDLVKSILSPDGDMALASVKFSPLTDDQAGRLSVAKSVITLRDSLREEFPDIEIYVLGGVLFELESYNAQINDQKLLMPLVIGLGIALLWYCLRSLAYAVTLFAVAFATVGLTTGSWGWLGIPFNQISSLGPLVVLVVAIADGIHIVSVYAQGLHRGLDRMAAMHESLVVNIQPITLATITTSIGFLSLNYCSSPGIYGFGNVIALGVVWAYIVTLAFLPAFILWLPSNKVPKPLGVAGFITKVSELVATQGNLLFYTSSAIIIATLAMLPLNKLDFDRYSFVDEDSDFHHVMEALREKIGNDQSLVYSIESGEYYGITQPEFLAQVDEFSQWVESQPEASFVRSYTDYLRARNKSEHDDDPAWDVLPDDQLQIIDYLVSYQLVQEIEPSLEPIFNTDYSAIRLVVGTSNLSNGELLALNDRIDEWIADNVDPRYEVLHGDNSILFARQDKNITNELMQGFTVSFILITLTMLVGLRSVRYGLLSIMPNLFPATIVFGFWGLFVGELNPYILMLFSISIGLVVDDSVHILSKYISSRREGKSPEDAVSYSLDRAGSAITITTASLAIGTIVLVLSNTFHFQNLSMLLTPIIVVALFLDILFLPPLLVRFDRWVERRAGIQSATT